MVCLDTPTSRATSSTLRPDSTCFTAAMICASVCALLLIRFLLPFVRLSDARCADYGEQVTSEGSRTAIVNAALSRMTTAPACATATGYAYPNWHSFSSELPLVAEFCMRAGFRQAFFRVLGAP